MFKRMHDIMVGSLILIAILLAMTTNYWVQYISHMDYLFKDNVTLGLIATVVVLLTLYDCKLGVAFAFVVAVVAVNLQYEGFEAFANMTTRPHTTRPYTTRPHTTRPHTTRPYTTRPHITRPYTTRPYTTRPYTTRPYTTRPHTTHQSIETFQNMASEQNVDTIAEKIEKQMQIPSGKCNIQDFNTYSAGKNYHGYDVSGCRYDLENKTQNTTVYGPPLSWCATYSNTNKLPIPFYPLNG